MATAVGPLAWALTLVALVAIVVVDLVVIGRRDRAVTVGQATRWVALYVALAVLFGVALVLWGPAGSGGQFFAGYLTEYSLSVDNLFVFTIIMARFAVPARAVDKTLYIGIVVSMLMRAVFIVAGTAAIAAASWTFYVLGAFLVYTAITLLFGDTDGEEEYHESRVVRLLQRILPVSSTYDGDRVVVRRDGRRMVTPLAIAIVAIGVANVVFALDSIPAILGLTQDTFVVITANAFALMGLRQLYFLVNGLLERLVHLNIGLSVILAFVGVKLIFEALDGSHVERIAGLDVPHIGTGLSLGVIVGVLVVTVLASLLSPRSVVSRSA